MAQLAQIGFKNKPVLEIIAAEPDSAIDDSVRQLCDAGWRQQT